MSKETTGAAADSIKSRPAAKTTTASKPDSCPAGFYCYIGPGIPGLIQHGAIYRGTHAEALSAAAAAIEKIPLIQTLIVPGDSLAEARLKAKKPGNALYRNCQRIAGKA